MMNTKKVDWNLAKEKIHKTWNKLTLDELEARKNNWQEVGALIEKKYNVPQREAYEKIEELLVSNHIAPQATPAEENDSLPSKAPRPKNVDAAKEDIREPLKNPPMDAA